MIISHVEGGLGNQMLDYMDFLAIKDTNPDQECYIETIVYNIKESHDVISMWNGYELEKVFGICEKNILNEVSIEIKKNIINDVKKSEFWENDWSISEAICNAFNNNSFRLENRCYDQVQHARGLISLM